VRGELIGFVFQSFQLLDGMTALENVMLPIELRGESNPGARARDLLTKVGLGQRTDHRPRQLSGGEQQRVAIARALMQDPKIVLADEPIASLDPMNAQLVMDDLRRIHEEDGRTVIANLHTLDTARRYCDRVIGMLHGRMVFDGTPDQLTTGVARDIYGADASFSEAATSTEINALERASA
ncbi:MAG: ATP-binding cassette domain-containing protein, partial [Pseudomonadota bacterium]